MYRKNKTLISLGMRGKKDVSDSMSNEKRAPAPGFFGMRGKKGPIVSHIVQVKMKRIGYLRLGRNRILT